MFQRMLQLYMENPIELSTPTNIQYAIFEALNEERQLIANELGALSWPEVQNTLRGVAKQRLFNRVIEKLPSTLQEYAFMSTQMNRKVMEFHIVYENLERFLIHLNYFLGAQADLCHFKNVNGYSHELPQTAPTRSAFFNFLADLGES